MTNPKTVYQIKVTLVGSKPPIWRRILVADTTTLAQLHTILQIVLGWTNSHLHMFKVGEQIYDDSSEYEDDDLGTKAEKNYKLKQIVQGEGFRFRYEYDFGDSWEHTLLVEKILPAEEKRRYPVCLAGKRACPPEDIGGIWGYQELLGAITDPVDKGNSELLDWVGSEFNPEGFDLEKVNDRLNHIKHGRFEEVGEATEYTPSEAEIKRTEKMLAWMQNLSIEQADLFVSLAVPRDMGAFLKYLLENRTAGTQSTGNLPLKAVRAICSRFVNPAVLDEVTSNHTYKLRSEYDVRPLFFIHILAEIGGLVTFGPGRVWQVTEDGEKYLQLPASIQTLVLLDRWWRLADWTIAFPFIGFHDGLPGGFNERARSALLGLTVGETSPYELFADDLIKQSGLIWPIADQVSARDILHSAIERMVIDRLAEFGVLESQYGTKVIGTYTYRKLTTICLTPVGKMMLELLE